MEPRKSEARRDIVVIGASAGGIQALRELVLALPGNLPASLFVVVHVAAESPGYLAEILQKSGPLPAVRAVDRAPIEPGRILVAAPDHHLLVEQGHVRVVTGPKENRHRPAIDPLFRSAAWAYGSRVAGIVLSGTLDDGAAGLWAIRSCGGVAIVQEPSDALHAELPTTVLRTLEVDHCLPVREIAPLLVRLAGESVPKERCVDESAGVETRFTTMNASMEELNGLGKPSMFTCPSCHGALWELQESSLLRYRCHTGHAYSSDSLLAEQEEATEAALYSAMRALQERAAALRRIQEHFKPRPGVRAFDYEGKAQELDRTADVLRRLLVTPGRAKDPASGGNGGAKGQPSGGNGE